MPSRPALGVVLGVVLVLGGCGDGEDGPLAERLRTADVRVFAWGTAVSRTCGARAAAEAGGRTALRTAVGRGDRTCWLGVRGRPVAGARDVRSVDEQDDGSVLVTLTPAAQRRLAAVDHLGLAVASDLLAVGDLVDGALRVPPPR